MSRQIAVVYEARPDFEIAVDLADRVIVDSIAWMTDDDVPFQRTWRSESSAGFRLSWAGIDHLAREAGVSVNGLYDEEPGEPDAHAASRAILYLRQEFPDLDAIVLIRDQDDQPLRRQGLNQARKKHGDGLPIAIGLAVPMREAWVLCGYDPDETELTRFDEARAQLKIDPRTRSHDVRDPKAVLRELTAGDLDRAAVLGECGVADAAGAGGRERAGGLPGRRAGPARRAVRAAGLTHGAAGLRVGVIGTSKTRK